MYHSLRTYDKATAPQQQVHKVPMQTQLYGNFVECQLVTCADLLAEVISDPRGPKTKMLRDHLLPLPNP